MTAKAFPMLSDAGLGRVDLGVVLGQTHAFAFVAGALLEARMLFNSALTRVREELARVALENGLN